MDLASSLLLGLETAFSFHNLLYCFIGVFLGMLVGVIPGIGTMSAMAMLFPLTFHLGPTPALIMLAGIWYGTGYGGRTASILLNIPGTVANAITCVDGYPMTKAGRGAAALLLTTIASFVGGSMGILLLMLFAPTIAAYAMNFGAAEYFSLMVLGLVASSTISEGSAIKGLAMVVVGIMIGCIGADIYTGTQRFTFGNVSLADGISLVALAMGLFGVAEVISSVGTVQSGQLSRLDVSFRSARPTRDEVRRSWFPTLRGASIGSFFGTLPGTGPSVASFLSYAVEKRVSREPERFGKGAVEGIMAPEAADNAAEMTSFIPTLSLGIPGSASMALMLGILMIHGIAPGPTLVSEQPALFWGLIISFWVGNVLLLVLNIPLIGMWVRLLTIPYRFMFPAVLAFICLGTFGTSNSIIDVWVVIFFGFLGYSMRLLDWPAPPLLLGFVLGPMLEEYFRRAMLISRGQPSIFIERGVSAFILAIAAALLVWTVVSIFRDGRSRRARQAAVNPAGALQGGDR